MVRVCVGPALIGNKYRIIQMAHNKEICSNFPSTHVCPGCPSRVRRGGRSRLRRSTFLLLLGFLLAHGSPDLLHDGTLAHCGALAHFRLDRTAKIRLLGVTQFFCNAKSVDQSYPPPYHLLSPGCAWVGSGEAAQNSSKTIVSLGCKRAFADATLSFRHHFLFLHLPCVRRTHIVSAYIYIYYFDHVPWTEEVLLGLERLVVV